MDKELKTKTVWRELFDMPPEIAGLPRDKRGYPIPAFVEYVKGEPDFRIMKLRHLIRCIKQNVCWICGMKMGKRKWFTIGPMCCINRVSAEPPSHRLCAQFAVKNCPFLARPMAKRNERDMDELGAVQAGIGIDRNPGVAAIWETRDYKLFQAGDGWLFEIGEPKNVSFWREGRTATRTEILESVRTGLPFLQEAAETDGEPGLRALVEQTNRFRALVLDKWAPGHD